MTRIILIRHGYSEYNKLHRFSGQLDIKLDEIGIDQANCTAKYVLENFAVDAVYSSDLSRAYDTAKTIADALGLPIVTSKQIRELDVGLWSGKNAEELYAEFPESYALYKKDVGKVRCDGGESYGDLWKRSLSEIERIARENDGKTVVIATHGGVIRCARTAWSGVPLEKIASVPHVTNASVTVAEYDGEAFKLLTVGYNEHLSNKITEFVINDIKEEQK
jgi:broad specificity phosphatase PhoE